jgi:ankyrin repeat protein
MSARLSAVLAGLLPCMALAGAPEEQLLVAIRASDYATVQRLLVSRKADPNRQLPDGATPLSWAVESQDPHLTQLLLRAKARPDAARNPAAAPLLLACEHGNAQVLTQLLDARADVNRARADGIAPLALCAGAAPAAIVARLLATGAAVDKADAGGQTALMWAAAKGRLDNLQVLLAHGANVNAVTGNGFTPLFFAIKSSNPQVSQAVLDAGGDPDHVGPEGTTAVQLAMYQKDYAAAARLVARGADLAAFDRNGNTLLHAAVIGNQMPLVGLLLARGANPNALTVKPRVEWRYEANFKTGDVVIHAKSPLLLAAEGGAAETMQLLAAGGADAGFSLDDGTTIVHAAVGSGRTAALAMALQLRPDPNVADGKGQTPLHVLLRSDPGAETAALMQLLASRGARTDIRNQSGETAADLLAQAPDGIKIAYVAAFGARTAAR